ncbi:MAG TPA: histidine triad nucleotide-binding protein [Pseudonocardiaceae bacterium]
MTAIPECLFCRIVAGELPTDVVAADERTFAFRDINPQAPVHVLVVPREHHRDAAELSAADPALLAETIAAGVRVAEREGIAGTGYRMLLNTGAHAGQTVFHAHLHVLGGEPLGGLVGGELRMPGDV